MGDKKHATVKIKNRNLSLLIVISCALGLYIAYKTVNQYDIYVRAILGVALILLLVADLSPKTRVEEPDEIELELPKDLRILVYPFVLTVLVFWALVQVIKLIYFLFSQFFT